MSNLTWSVACECRLLSPSRIYKQQYQSIANKTRLVAACLQIVSSNASLSYDAVVRHLADGVAVLPQGADPEAPEYISDFDGHDTAEVQRFGQHELLDHAAFVVQQVGPVLGRHALKVRFGQPGILLGFSLNCHRKAFSFPFFSFLFFSFLFFSFLFFFFYSLKVRWCYTVPMSVIMPLPMSKSEQLSVILPIVN